MQIAPLTLELKIDSSKLLKTIKKLKRRVFFLNLKIKLKKFFKLLWLDIQIFYYKFIILLHEILGYSTTE